MNSKNIGKQNNNDISNHNALIKITTANSGINHTMLSGASQAP